MSRNVHEETSEVMQVITYRDTAAQKAKLILLGGGKWIRKQVKDAKLPEKKVKP